FQQSHEFSSVSNHFLTWIGSPKSKLPKFETVTNYKLLLCTTKSYHRLPAQNAHSSATWLSFSAFDLRRTALRPLANAAHDARTRGTTRPRPRTAPPAHPPAHAALGTRHSER